MATTASDKMFARDADVLLASLLFCYFLAEMEYRTQELETIIF